MKMIGKIDDYLTEGFLKKKIENMKGDLEDKFGPEGGKLVDVIYKQLMKIPEFKKASMDRQGEIAMTVLSMLKKGAY